MKKFIIYILLLSMCLIDTIPTYAAQTKVPKIDAKSAIVMDAQTGQILYEKSMNKIKYPASLTKLMTVLLTLENCKLNEKVTFSQEAVYGIEPGSSNIGILPGEILTVKQCLYGMMLESANEVCSAIAEHISGSVEQFSKLMTKRAKELGCENTQFKNANGLHHDKHYTTAYDMALILKEVLKYPEFRTIASSRNYRLKKTNKQKGRWLGNHHKMIRYPTESIYSLSPSLTPTSGKTAFTTRAKTCLATSATNGDMELICIVMEDTGISVYWDTKHLLEYFFNNYEHIKPLQSYEVQTIESDNFIAHNFFSLVQPQILTIHINANYIVSVPKNYTKKRLTTSFKQQLDTNHDILGTLSIYYNKKKIGQTPVFFTPFIADSISHITAYKEFDFSHFSPNHFHFYMLSTTERGFLLGCTLIFLLLALKFLHFYMQLIQKRKALNQRCHSRSNKCNN